ncbi:MAG: peptidase S1 [Hyphomonadaceae bacterium]|nr:peptidase S1 [Hyphomonadaceae bacterium]MCA8886979.1 peptidase S1 [Hyphomonadaceae bacterium]
MSEVGGPANHASADAPDYSLDPAYGTIELVSGFQPDPHSMSILAGGGYDASQISGCVGWVATAPDYRVNFTAGSAGLPLIFSVQSDADTTLVINDAQGNWVCNDDTDGLNPVVRFDTPASGQYDVWLGTFAEGSLEPSTLNVSELTPQ